MTTFSGKFSINFMANNGDIMKRIFSYLLCVSLIFPSLGKAGPDDWDSESDLAGIGLLRSLRSVYDNAMHPSSRHQQECEPDVMFKSKVPEVLDWGKLEPSLQHLPPKVLLNIFSGWMKNPNPVLCKFLKKCRGWSCALTLN